MKSRITIITLFLLLTSLALAACGTQQPENQKEEEGTKTIYVGPQLVDCEGVAPQQCLLIKEEPQAEYTLFYDPIAGFNYEEGYEYELRIKEETVENPPADSSSIKWTLVEEVSKIPAQPTEAPSQPEEAETTEGGEMITVYVGPQLVECVGVAPQQCMQVKLSPEDDYTLFYDQIEGFEYVPGYEYELRVLVEPVENPPADGSSRRYSLVEEVSRTPATDDETGPDVALPADTILEGLTWTLLSLKAPDGQPQEVLQDTRITAEFKDGQVTGTAGCNRYFGSYETDGDSLTIGPAGSTMMYCPPEELMLQETAYLASLSNVASYDIADDQLHLNDADGETILLFAMDEPLSLMGVTWQAISYNNGSEAVVSVIIGTEITAVFGNDGVLSGLAGCNSYSAGYETEGSSITIGPAASTRKFCSEPEGIMDQESQYLAALQDAAVYRIEGDTLEIRDVDGALLANYRIAKPASLTGTAWNLLFHNNGQEAMVSTIIGTQITAVFSEEGLLTGSAGCNTYTAGYEINGSAITISPAATSRSFCAEPEGIMEQESQYLAALQNGALYQLDEDKLELRDANGSGVASYEAIDLTSEEAGSTTTIVESTEAAQDTTSVEEESVNSAAESDEITVSEELANALGNASYPIDYAGTGSVQLTNGEFRQPAAEDSAADIITQTTDHVAVGEMPVGEPVVAVILVSQTGGTGTFYDLAVMAEQDGQLASRGTAYLGDRIIVNSLSIENGQIVVDMIVQGPEDPFSSPTQQVLQTYELQGAELQKTSSKVIGTVEAQSENRSEIMGIVWEWQELTTPVEQVIIDNSDKYTIEFLSDGQITVLADCNSGTGTYDLNSNRLTIDITSTTLALCAPESQSDLFFRNLNAAASYFMEADNLFIEQYADGGTMRFVKN